MPRKVSRLVLLTAIVLILLYLLHGASQNPNLPSVRLQTSRPESQSQSQSPAESQFESQPQPGVAFDWKAAPQFFPPDSIAPLPTGKLHEFPAIQAPASAFKHSQTNDDRRTAVRNAFKRSYDAYKSHAWLRDELAPVSGGGKDTFGGWAATLVDSLDTLWIMGFKTEFAEAVSAVVGIDWSDTPDGAANLFETTIRHLGGLLSAYDLSGEQALLRKATELGEMLYMGFDTPNRMPGFWLNYQNAKTGSQVAGTNDPSSAAASMCLEFTRLSQLTGDPKFYDATDRVTRFLDDVQSKTNLPGMWPVTMNFRLGQAPGSTFTLGALADSLYEYLPKMHLLVGGVDARYESMYRKSMDAVVEHLLFRPMTPDLVDVLFSGDAIVEDKGVRKVPRGQHLTCFVGGMFALGGKLFGIEEHVAVGELLAKGCGWAYSSFPTGVMPEIFEMVACPTLEPCVWDEKRWKKETTSSDLPRGFKSVQDTRYILRPEAIESIFIMYRVTGKTEFQELAWQMFESIMAATETDLANSAIKDVTAKGKTSKADSMESFWMAETLKYFYLIFSPPDLISLDEYVLNTEAHPLRRPH